MRRTVSCGLTEPAPRKPPQEAGGLRREDAARVTGATERMMLSIVVPVWGTRHDLSRLLPALQRALEGVEPRSEILVCATDPSLRQVVETASATFVESKSSGYGDILRTGIDAAQGELVMTMDADFAYAADFVPIIWAHRDDAEVVIGSRYVRGAVAEMGFSRRTASRLLNWVYRFGLSVPFRDLSSGFRLYRRRVLLDIQPLEAHGLDVLPEIMVKAQCQGWRVIEVPVWYRGAEPWNRMRMVQFGLAYLETLGRLLSLRNSVRAADYDNRAFDSWIPLQRSWQRRRFEVVHSFMGPQASRATLDIGCGSSRIVQTLPGVVGMDLGMHKLRWLRAPGRHLVRGDRTHPQGSGPSGGARPRDRTGRVADLGNARLQPAAMALPGVALRQGVPERVRERTHQPVHASRTPAGPRGARSFDRERPLRRRLGDDLLGPGRRPDVKRRRPLRVRARRPGSTPRLSPSSRGVRSPGRSRTRRQRPSERSPIRP